LPAKWYEDPQHPNWARLEEASLRQLAKETGFNESPIRKFYHRHVNAGHALPPLLGSAVMRVARDDSSSGNVVDRSTILEAENRDLRRRVRKLEEGETQTERVVQRLEEAIARTRPSWEAGSTMYRDAPGDEGPSEKTSQEMALLYSDLHATEVVSLEGTRGLNEYNWDVMLDRMAGIQRGVLSHREHYRFPISVLDVWMLGDMLSGDIHEELAITNDRPTAEGIVDLAYAHVPWLLRFAEEFPLVRVRAVAGNHPRFAQKPSAKQYHNNADWLFYKMLEALLKGHPQFEFDIPRSSMNVVKVADRWRVLLMHGDGIRTTMPGVPWGGVHRRVTTLEAQFSQARQPLDYVAFGHWHTRNSLDGIQAETIMNGSVKGVDEYSLQKFGSGRAASQTLLTIHPEHGITGNYPIHLQGRTPASEGW
jgi:hypothetical protein